jgi:hypothetical protein
MQAVEPIHSPTYEKAQNGTRQGSDQYGGYNNEHGRPGESHNPRGLEKCRERQRTGAAEDPTQHPAFRRVVIAGAVMFGIAPGHLKVLRS